MTTYSEYRDSLPYARGAEVFDPPIGPSHERWLDPADVDQEIEECPAVGKMTRNHKLVPMLQWCTRAIYHDGDHAAHGGNTVMFARWPR